MADPDRKINLDLPSDDESDLELDPSEISLIKDFEEEFKDRFTDDDKVFTDFCKQKPKPPPIVFPFDQFHNNRGGHRGGGRYQHRGNRHNYKNHRSGNNPYGNNYTHNYKNNWNQDRPPSYKNPRMDTTNSGGS